MNADAQTLNAEAIDIIQKSLVEISEKSKSSSADVKKLAETLEQNLTLMKSQLESIKAKLDTM